MILNRQQRIAVVALYMALLCLNANGQAKPMIKGVVIDPSADQRGVAEIRIDVHSSTGQYLGNDNTDAQGVFEITCNDFADRIEIDVYDMGFRSRGYQYANAWFSGLSGRQNMIVNPTVTKTSEETPEAARSNVQSLRRRFSALRPEARASIEAYLASAVRDHRDKPDFGFGEDLEAVVRLLQPTSEPTAISDRWAWNFEAVGGGLWKWQIPESVNNPVRLQPERIAVTASSLDFTHVGSFGITTTPSGSLLFNNLKQGGHSAVYMCKVDLPNDPQAWVPAVSGGLFTSIASDASQPWIVTGNSLGSVELKSASDLSTLATFEVGRTPVAAMTVSRDGRLFAAVTVDGTFKAWRVPEDLNPRDAHEIRGGFLPKAFPNTISFAPDGKSLVVGTGLGTVENAIVTVDLANETAGQINVLDRDASATNLAFGSKPSEFLVRNVYGTTSVMSLSRSDNGVSLEEKGRLQGIRDFQVVPSGDSAVVWPSAQADAVAFPIDKLLRVEEFSEPQYGIKRQF